MTRRIRPVPGRPGRPLPARTLAVLGLCLALQVPSGASESGGGSGLQLLASEGALFFWDGASTELRPAPAGLASGPPGFRAVLPLDEGRVLLVEPAAQPAGKQKEKKVREGEAVVVGLAEAGASRGAVVPFEGAPSAAAVAPDGRRAYVVSWRGVPGESGSRGWLHAIDVDQAKAADSSLLSAPAFGLATDKAGGRLYLGLKDRIQTYGADPVRVSWQYRSPGQNGPMALAPEADVLAVGRGAEVALFDPSRLQAVGPEERRARKDDATTVATLPFVVTRLFWSEDGSLLAAIGSHGLVFVDPGNGALLWPPHAIDFASARDALVLRFPGSDHDLVVALAPAGTVSALRAPVPSAPVVPPPAKIAEPPVQVAGAAAPPPEAPAAPAHVTNGKLPQEAAGEPQRNAEVDAKAAEPPAARHDAPAVAETGATAPDEAAPEDSGPPRLRGRVSGKGARTIVLYGPNNILKEAIRVELQADGSWSLDLPAPGTYRVVPIGDGSTPIPVVPTFRTVTVRAGISESGLDFAVR